MLSSVISKNLHVDEAYQSCLGTRLKLTLLGLNSFFHSISMMDVFYTRMKAVLTLTWYEDFGMHKDNYGPNVSSIPYFLNIRDTIE